MYLLAIYILKEVLHILIGGRKALINHVNRLVEVVELISIVRKHAVGGAMCPIIILEK